LATFRRPWDQEKSVQDGFYAAPLVPLIRNTTANRQGTPQPLTGGRHAGRYIGTEFQLLLGWQIDRHVDAIASYVHFAAGSTITASGGKSVDFLGTRIAYRF